MKTISVIVPVYNVEGYLEKCVDSIINQSYKNLEIILVDDGSTDNSPVICDSYAEKDNRIKVIHKENGGLSDARNAGIKVASGEYLGFIDSDDYIDTRMYEILHSNIEKYQCDLAVCSFYHSYKSGNVCKGNNTKNIEVMDSKQSIKNLNCIHPMAWNKLYKKSIFNNLLYPVGRYNEDTFIIMDILTSIESCVVVDEPLYYYVMREQSITKARFQKKHLDIIDAWKRNLNIISAKYPELTEFIESKLHSAHFQVIDKIIMEPNYKDFQEYLILRDYIKDNFKKIISSKYITVKRKIMCMLLLTTPGAYRVINLKINEKNRLFG